MYSVEQGCTGEVGWAAKELLLRDRKLTWNLWNTSVTKY